MATDFNALVAAKAADAKDHAVKKAVADASRAVWVAAQKTAGVYEAPLPGRPGFPPSPQAAPTPGPTDLNALAKTHAANLAALATSKAALAASTQSLATALAAAGA